MEVSVPKNVASLVARINAISHERALYLTTMRISKEIGQEQKRLEKFKKRKNREYDRAMTANARRVVDELLRDNTPVVKEMKRLLVRAFKKDGEERYVQQIPENGSVSQKALSALTEAELCYAAFRRSSASAADPIEIVLHEGGEYAAAVLKADAKKRALLRIEQKLAKQ